MKIMKNLRIGLMILIYFSLGTEQTFNHPVYGKTQPSLGEEIHGYEILSSRTAHEISEPAFRKKRDEGDFADIHSKLTMVARIFSGIAMRIAIHEGTVTGDEIIAELLNLEDSLKLDDVANFDKTRVDIFFDELGRLSVSDTTYLNKFEKKVEAMNLLREQYEKISDPNDKTSLNEYIGKVKVFPDLGVKLEVFKTAGNKVSSAILSLDSINKGQVASLDADDLRSIKKNLDRILNLSTEVEAALGTLASYEDLIGTKILESAMVQNVDLIKQFNKWNAMLDPLNSKVNSSYTTFIGEMTNVSPKFDKITSDLDLIQQLGSTKSARKIPSGFVNGFLDVIKLSQDVQDTWLPTVIDQYVLELIKSELKSLELFATIFPDLDAKWKNVHASKALTPIASVATTFNQAKASVGSETFAKIEEMAKPTKMDFVNDLTSLVENILKFREELNTLFVRFTTISKMAELKNLKSLVQFKEKIDFTSPRTLDQVHIEMPKKGELTPLLQALKNLQPLFSEIENFLVGDKLANLAAEIENKKSATDSFLTGDGKTEFFKYCDFLKDAKPQLESLLPPATLIRTIREIQKDASFDVSLQEITKNISTSTQDFVNLRNVPGSIKSTKTPRIDELIQLKAITGHAKTIGEAVAVLNTVQTILSNKTSILEMVGEVGNVNGIINNASDSLPNKEKWKRDWRRFGELATYFGSFFTTLETSMASVSRVRRGVSSLEDYANQLSKLKNLPDFKTDLKPMMAVLKELPNAPSGMLATMESIDKLDLQFSSHTSALTNAGTSVSNVVTLFGNAQNLTNNAPAAPAQNFPNKLSDSSKNLAASGKVDAESDDGVNVGLVVGICFAAVILVAASIGVARFLLMKKRREQPNSKDKDPESGSNKKPDSSTSASHPTATPSTSAEQKVEKKEKVENVEKVEKNEKAETIETTESNAKSSMNQTNQTTDGTVSMEFCNEVVDEGPTPKNILKLAFQVQRHTHELLKKAKEMTPENKETFNAEMKRHQDDIDRLSLKMSKDAVNRVRTEADQEYDFIVSRTAAQIEMERKNLDENDLIVSITKRFTALLSNILDELKSANDAWRLFNQGGTTNIYKYKVSFEKIKAWFDRNAGKPKRLTLALAPFALRIEWVGEEIARLISQKKLKFEEQKKSDPKVTSSDRLYFDHSRFKLKNGKSVNIAEFEMPYGGYMYQGTEPKPGAPMEEMLQMIWDAELSYLVTWKPILSVLKNTETFTIKESNSNLEEHQKDFVVEWMDNGKLRARTFVIMKEFILKNKMTKQTRTFTGYCFQHWHTHVIPRNPETYFTAIENVLDHVTRQKDEAVLIIDDEVGTRGSSLILAEHIASHVSTYGKLAAELSVHMLTLSKKRSKMFTDPDVVMLGLTLAMKLILVGHKNMKCTEEHKKYLEVLKKCQNKDNDDAVKKQRWPKTWKEIEVIRAEGDTLENVEDLPVAKTRIDMMESLETHEETKSKQSAVQLSMTPSTAKELITVERPAAATVQQPAAVQKPSVGKRSTSRKK